MANKENTGSEQTNRGWGVSDIKDHSLSLVIEGLWLKGLNKDARLLEKVDAQLSALKEENERLRKNISRSKLEGWLQACLESALEDAEPTAEVFEDLIELINKGDLDL